jgi:hypothetical protein
MNKAKKLRKKLGIAFYLPEDDGARLKNATKNIKVIKRSRRKSKNQSK